MSPDAASSSLISTGSMASTASTPGVCTSARELSPSPGETRCSASITYVQNRTGSLSCSSIPNHANGRASSSDVCQSASTVDFPQPAGARITVSFRFGPHSTWSNRVRATRCRATGGCSFDQISGSCAPSTSLESSAIAGSYCRLRDPPEAPRTGNVGG